jgi:hypothetical protein
MTRALPALALSVLLLAGCGSTQTAKDLLSIATPSVPLASAEAEAQAKRFAPGAGKALIYVFRVNDTGAAKRLSVSLNGRAVGSLVGSTYFALEVDPGRYSLGLSDGSATEVRIEAAAGSRHFVELGTETGFTTPTGYLVLAKESEGRAAVGRGRMAQGEFAGLGPAPAAAAKPATAPEPKPAAAASPKPVPAASPKAAADASPVADKSYPQQLRELKQLQNEGIITEQEFEAKKKQILERM